MGEIQRQQAYRIKLVWGERGESNPQPCHHEGPALPLSYARLKQGEQPLTAPSAPFLGFGDLDVDWRATDVV